MKKLNIITLAVIFFSLSAFAQSVPNLRNRTDSLNFALGLWQGDLIKMYHLNDEETASEGLKSLLKGLDAGLKVNPKFAGLEALGTDFGQWLRGQRESGLLGNPSLTVNIELIKQGLINGIHEFDQMMTAEAAQEYLNLTLQRLQEAQVEEMFGTNRRAGEEFLAENAAKEGVVTLPSGLQYRVITTGRGKIPTVDDIVRVHYHGTLVDGTVFDSSVQRGQDITFPVTGVISGWTEALQLMPVGSKWMLYIPQELAYGAQDGGMIPPFSALIFEVELLGIEK